VGEVVEPPRDLVEEVDRRVVTDQWVPDVAECTPNAGARLGNVVGMVGLGDVDQWIEVSVGHSGDPMSARWRREK